MKYASDGNFKMVTICQVIPVNAAMLYKHFCELDHHSYKSPASNYDWFSDFTFSSTSISTNFQLDVRLNLQFVIRLDL